MEALSSDPSAKRSALKVSLGTGRVLDNDPELHGSGSWWEDLWFFRLTRALFSSMNAQEASDAIHHKELRRPDSSDGRRRGEYFRFNIDFAGREPRLDDVSKMRELKDLARDSILNSNAKQLDRLARCIIAEYFVFELEAVPRRENGHYSCIGYILCRLRSGSTAFDQLLARLTRSSAKFLLRGRQLLGRVLDRSSRGRDGNFRKRVCFDVSRKQDMFSLSLQEGELEPCSISGSPFSIDWLLEAQRLDRKFVRKRGMTDNEATPRKHRRLSY